jgi:hypothetical protein
MDGRRRYLDERNEITANGVIPRDPIDVSLPRLPGYVFSTPVLVSTAVPKQNFRTVDY